MSESEEVRAERGRRNIEGRWGPYRQARIAAGLAPTREQEVGRPARFIDDPEAEAYWLAEVDRLRLVTSTDRTARRLAAKHLADSVTADLSQYSPDDSPSTAPEGDLEVLVAYWGNEAVRWRRRAERDIAMARTHHEYADAAERELSRALLRRRGAL
jgi:hypothetical protein